MPLSIAIVLVLVALTIGAFLYSRTKGEAPESVNKNWELALSNEKSQVGQILLKAARPLTNIPSIYQAGESPQYRYIQDKLLASGAYAGSVEVFLAVQTLAGILAMILLFLLFATGISGIFMIAASIMAAAIAGLPWNLVYKKAKDRADAVTKSLPEFAELLIMPLESGMPVLSSLAFTAERIPGPVSEEVQNLRTVISSRSMPEAQAFQFAAARLGTPEAVAFFTALMQAHIEGNKLIKNLQAQATALRDAAHQKSRADAKKLPVKLVIIFVIHLIPALLAVALLPTFISLGNL